MSSQLGILPVTLDRYLCSWIKRSRFCEKYPNECEKPQDLTMFCKKHTDFCEQVGNYSSLENLKLPTKKISGDNHSYYADIALTAAELVPVCIYFRATVGAEICKSNYILTNNKLSSENAMCHILNSRLTISSWNDPLINLKVAPLPSLIILVDFMPHEKVNPKAQTYGQFMMTSPFDFTDPAVFGQVIMPGKTYVVISQPVEKFLLPPPYSTQCRDYVTQWKRNYTAPLGLDSCVMQCYLKAELEYASCVLKGLWYPHEHRFCNPEETKSLVEQAAKWNCYKDCGRPCYSLDFEIEVRETDLKPYTMQTERKSFELTARRNLTDDLILKRFGIISVFFRKPEIYTYTYNAKYEAIELFSYLGGFVGMWLGLSLLSVYDFFIWFLTHFKFRRCKNINNNIP